MSFAGLQLVPPPLVPVVRALLASQGATNVITDSGELDATALVALGFNKVEIRTALTPPVTLDLNAPSDPQTEAIARRVQPAIILSGRAGRAEIAPYGVPLGVSPEVKRAGLSLGLGLIGAGVGLMLFRAARR